MALFKGRGHGSVIGLQSPGYQLVMARIGEYAHHVEELRLGQDERAWAERTLDDVKKALEFRIGRVFPYPKYDYAWATLRQLRHLFCHCSPVNRLLGMVVEDIEGDVSYYLPKEETTVREELKNLRKRLMGLLPGDDHDDKKKADAHRESETRLRAELEALSRRAAMAREGYWLKVNMTRNRLFVMGTILAVLLVVALFLLPAVIFPDEDDLGRGFYWAIALAGMIGGVISALIGAEPLDTRAAIFYIKRRLLYLRPFVGGTLALIAYIALRSGTISFPSLNAETSPLFALVVAFTAGFSERLFIRGILKAALPRGEEKAETEQPKE